MTLDPNNAKPEDGKQPEAEPVNPNPQGEGETPSSSDPTPAPVPVNPEPSNLEGGNQDPPEAGDPPAGDPPANPPIDYEKAYAESTRQYQVLQGQLQEMNRQLGEITNDEIPTDQDMVNLYGEQWNDLPPIQKDISKKQVVQGRRMNNISLIVSKSVKTSEEAQKITDAIARNPELKGKEEDFMKFASHPTRKGTPADDLVKAFLYDHRQPETPPSPQPTPISALESGAPSGGGAQPDTSGELSAEELKHLRTSDPKKYNEMIQSGKIK